VTAALVTGVLFLGPDRGSVGAATRKAGATAAPAPQYDVALGDSIAAGAGASLPTDDYVTLVYQHVLSRYPGLQLVNLACSGATTGSMISGPGCSYTTGTQLGDAEAFLRAHAGRVALVTIDIGANNVDSCLGPSGIDAACVESGFEEITTQLPEILSGLTTADPGVAIYGMDYYDPFLDQWLTGATGQAVAEESEADTVALNGSLEQIYAAADAATADPASLFDTTDFALTGSWDGEVVPENVALICAWTLMCTDNDIHPDDTGHAEIARAFEKVIDHIAVTTTVLPAATAGQPYSGQLSATGGHPPDKWSVVAGRGVLPPGLQLGRSSGLISGVPTTAGRYAFAVKVGDTRVAPDPSQHQTATVAFSISVG
jgi:lysophospholipase L1-like esterase